MLPCTFPTSCEVGILMNKLKIRNKTDVLKMDCSCFIGRTFISWVFYKHDSVIFCYWILPWGRVKSVWFFFFFPFLSNDLIFLSGWLNDSLFVTFEGYVSNLIALCQIFLGGNSGLRLFTISLNYCFRVSHCACPAVFFRCQAQLPFQSSLKPFINKELLSFMRPSWMEQGPCSPEVYRFMGETDRLNQPV